MGSIVVLYEIEGADSVGGGDVGLGLFFECHAVVGGGATIFNSDPLSFCFVGKGEGEKRRELKKRGRKKRREEKKKKRKEKKRKEKKRKEKKRKEKKRKEKKRKEKEKKRKRKEKKRKEKKRKEKKRKEKKRKEKREEKEKGKRKANEETQAFLHLCEGQREKIVLQFQHLEQKRQWASYTSAHLPLVVLLVVVLLVVHPPGRGLVNEKRKEGVE